MICRIVEGHSQKIIGRQVHRSEEAVYYALKTVGFSGQPAVFDFGKPYTASNFIQLKKATGLTASELAQAMGVPSGQLVEATRPGRALGNRRIRPELARKVIAWRDDTLRIFFGKAQTSHSAGAIDKRELLKTFIPDLHLSYDLILSVLRKLRKHLQHGAAPQYDKLQDYFCAQAESEVREKRSDVFVDFMPWAPELVPLLESRLSRIAAQESFPPLVHELIGSRWNLAPSIVSEAMRRRTRHIPPIEMRYRIQASSVAAGRSNATQATKTRGTGRDPGRPELSEIETQEFKIGAMVDGVLAHFSTGAGILTRAKRELPGSANQWGAKLRDAKFSESEIDALLSSRIPKTAAIRWVAVQNRLEFRNVQNLYSSFRQLHGK